MFNRVKVSTYDKLAFPEHVLNSPDFFLYRKGYPFRENEVKTNDIRDPVVKQYMDQWYDWSQEEFILVWDNPCVIEPVSGWAITDGRNLLYYSLGISRTWFQARPKLLDFISRKDVKVGKAISFRDTGEENYFHFFNDVVAKYFFLREHNISFEDRSVIISAKLYSKPYFQWYMSQSPEFQKLKWVVQNDEYIAATSVVFCKPLTHRKDLFERIFKTLKAVSLVQSKRLFINRGKSRLRTISNFAELTNVLRKHNIEIIDPDLLAPAVQQTLFSQASFIAGIHGAGLTNLYFRNEHCSVLEIFPPPSEDYLPFHYIMLAGMKDFPYQAIIGEGKRLDISGSFSIDIAKLEALIVSMLQ